MSLVPLLATTAVDLPPLILASVLTSLVVIYFASKLLGELCVRVGLPAVLGELVGGVIIGGSVLKLLVFAEGDINPEALLALAQSSQIMHLLEATAGLGADALTEVFSAQSEIIDLLAEIGVIVLLFEIGLESDLKELLRVGTQAAAVAVIGVTIPFALGTLGLLYFFHVPTVAAIFAGAALTATSIGITARVLAEMQKINSAEGQVIIGAAVLDDILGIVILAVVASLAKTGEVIISDVAMIIVSAVVFLVGAIILGRLLSPLLVSVIRGMRTRGSLLIPAVILAFILAYIGQAIGLEGILGAFAAGLILAETDLSHNVEEQLRPISDFLVPIFFVVVGAKTNLEVLNPIEPANREGLIIASFLIGVAIIGKLAAGLGAFGKAGINRYAIGVGMIPRGEVGLVFAGVGSASGALPDSLDAAIIVMVIATTFIAPLWLRSAFGSGEEAANLTELVATETEAERQEELAITPDAVASEVERPADA